MDILLLVSIGIILCFLLFVAIQARKLYFDEKIAQNRIPLDQILGQQEREERQQQRGPRIIGGQRARGPRPRRPARDGGNEDSGAEEGNELVQRRGRGGDESGSEEEDGYVDDIALPEGKVGKKKFAKLQAKAEKRANRESELRERDERKQREKEKEEQERKLSEKEKQEQLAREEEQRKQKEEQERREHEEYLALKAHFQVEEEGLDAADDDAAQNLLREFLAYVQHTKVVNLDELAARFKLKTAEAAERVQSLLEEGTLTGVLDDRGKFICITEEELRAVAKFVNQRGRVSVSELADYSNQLIRLQPLSSQI